jgi:tetratricopeptide (TPR) repeat protein
MTGDSSRATATADQFEAAFPDDTLLRFNYVPVLRAQIALNQNDPARAVRLLQASVPYELGPAHALYGGLYPVYVRGEAYLAARQGTEAAIEFQKILDHRGVVGSDPIGALAHLQLGRAYILSGDKVRATQCYEAFLALWKDADPGIPILKQAHDEYAQLK